MQSPHGTTREGTNRACWHTNSAYTAPMSLTRCTKESLVAGAYSEKSSRGLTEVVKMTVGVLRTTLTNSETPIWYKQTRMFASRLPHAARNSISTCSSYRGTASCLLHATLDLNDGLHLILGCGSSGSPSPSWDLSLIQLIDLGGRPPT